MPQYTADADTDAGIDLTLFHLGDCPNCHAYLEQMKVTIALTGRLREEDVEPAAMDELMDVFKDWKG